MTENAFTPDAATIEITDRATWAVNSLLEAGQDDLAADVAASYDSELRSHLRSHLRKAS